MRLLLDTHILLAIGEGTLQKRYPKQWTLIQTDENDLFGSVASIWEMSIKIGIGKLDLETSLPEFASYLSGLNISWLAIVLEHAANPAKPEPYTRDQFDRMLLAQCAAENLRLVTIDRALAEHPLAVR
jgi:PIN domain nuclease of toxin-antitoxin system